MNQTSKCHQIQGCTGLYIDAFRAFKNKTRDKNSTFILTHYHSDHYNGLPRGSKKSKANDTSKSSSNTYTGPALIHCTPVTGALLREIHGIEPEFIVEHPYGHTWTHEFTRQVMKNGNPNNAKHKAVAEITFYDANHCPGAAIIYIHILDQDKHHVHTGDMRFNLEKFSTYPLIQQAVQQNKIDLLYLDTTYSKPKHNFLPQDEAIQNISSNVKRLLGGNNEILQMKKKSFFQPRKKKEQVEEGNPKSKSESTKMQRTLVLLSCYSIGKEKVLWHSLSNQSKKCMSIKPNTKCCNVYSQRAEMMKNVAIMLAIMLVI